MPQFNELERPQIDIDVGYKIYILALGESNEKIKGKEESDFTEKIAKDASLKGIGTHHLKIDRVLIKYKVILTSLSTPIKGLIL